MNAPRPNVSVFVSYARANKSLVSKFLERFKEQAGPSRRFRYSFWQDGDILVGEDWHEAIQKALEDCDLGLLMISPAFLGSQYITEHELPRFVGARAKTVIPVLLHPVDAKLHDLKGLEDRQIFRLDRSTFRTPKSFADCSGPRRDEFALELFRHVEARLGRQFPDASRVSRSRPG